MEIYPAIDIRGGRCVRLRQGDYARETVFQDDPLTVALRWEREGARALHVVDLDGARAGSPQHTALLGELMRAVHIPCQVGGGIRDEAAIAALLEAGAARVVVGTRALAEPDWLRRVAALFPGRIALGLDARDGRVATHGWFQTSAVAAVDFARMVDSLELAAIIYTDIARDGMMQGPALASTRVLAESVRTGVIASGGIGSLADLQQVRRLPVAGCVVGRALYEGAFSLGDALTVASSDTPG